MGGPNKLLLPYGKSTVVGTVVRTLFSCGLDVVVVTGRDAEEVAKAAEPARCVFNPLFETGLGSSIACGVEAAPPGAVLIALGDMPDLRKSVVEELVAALDDERKIIAPVYIEGADRRGHTAAH
jgi:molybdenum cofactor cytidylyltransferase